MSAATRPYGNGYLSYTGPNVPVHVAIATKAYGKKLPKGAEVHHVDENKTNNDPSNLVVCPSKAYHKLLHARQRILDAGGNPNTQKICGMCREVLFREGFSKNKSNYDGLQMHCRACLNQYRKDKGYK